MTNYDAIDNNIALDLGATVSAGVASQVGSINCVPISDAVSGTAVACYVKGVITHAVTAVDDMGNAAVSVGDKLYLNSGVLNVDSVTGGTAFGVALEDVTSGATATIRVKIEQY